MSISIAYIPKGYTSEQKQIMIAKTKESIMKGFNLTDKHSFVFIQEIEDDCRDAQTKNLKYLLVYTTVGKSLEGKNLICKGFDDACATAFGEDKGKTVVIFKEHSDENAGTNGYLRPLKPKKQP